MDGEREFAAGMGARLVDPASIREEELAGASVRSRGDVLLGPPLQELRRRNDADEPVPFAPFDPGRRVATETTVGPARKPKTVSQLKIERGQPSRSGSRFRVAHTAVSLIVVGSAGGAWIDTT